MIDATQIFDGVLPNIGSAVTTTRVSTNTLDLLAARDVGAGEPLGIHVQVIEAFVGGTSVVVSYEVGATAGSTYYALVATPVIPAAQLIAGEQIARFALPVNQVLNAASGVLNAPGRYIRLLYTVVGTFTAGTVFAYLNPRPDRNAFTAYPRNYTVYVDPDQI